MRHIETFESYDQKLIDKLLDKMNSDGKDSLTKQEREYLSDPHNRTLKMEIPEFDIPDTDPNERQESQDEYEQFYGFPVGDTFLFAPYESDNGFQVVINPKSYWDSENCCYDQHIDSILIDMPRGFGEASESDFEYNGNA